MKLLPAILRALIALPVAGPLILIAACLPWKSRLHQCLLDSAFRLMGL
jgi:hypothetical protein